MPELIYPTPLQSVAGSGGVNGPPYLKYLKHRKDWAAVTLISTYEDQGIDTNTSADNVAQEYTLIYNGLTDEQAQILDNFWDIHGKHTTFTFVEPRDKPWTDIEGDTVTGCRFISYEADHEQVRTIQSRTVRIGKYPS